MTKLEKKKLLLLGNNYKVMKRFVFGEKKNEAMYNTGARVCALQGQGALLH